MFVDVAVAVVAVVAAVVAAVVVVERLQPLRLLTNYLSWRLVTEKKRRRILVNLII